MMGRMVGYDGLCDRFRWAKGHPSVKTIDIVITTGFHVQIKVAKYVENEFRGIRTHRIV